MWSSSVIILPTCTVGQASVDGTTARSFTCTETVTTGPL